MRSLMASTSIISLIALSALGTGEWEQDDANTSKDDGNKNADCGGVKGWAGGLEAFQTTHEGNGFKTTGKVGAVWDGSQYESVSAPAPVEKINWVTHAYTRDQGGFPTWTVGVNISSVVSVSGSASQMAPSDPQWWWDTNASITFLGVTCRYFDASTEEWGDLVPSNYPNPNWPNGGVNDGGAGAAWDAPNNNSQNHTSPMTYVNPPPPNGNTDNNGWAFQTTGNMTKLTVTAKWKSIGRPASVDNASVSNERHQLAFTFTSSTG